MASAERTAIIVINKSDPGIVDTLTSLDALARVRAGTAEVVVVDASEGRFDEVRERFPGVRWIDFMPLPGRPSIPHQRNQGVASTDAGLVVFIDASCVPGPDWLEQLCAPIESGEETIVAGAHRSPDQRSIRDLATERLRTRSYLTEAPTINLAIRRSTLDELGGFDESFRYGSDVDLTWRAVQAGQRIRYVPEAYVTHDWGDVRAEVGRSRAYGRARAHLYMKHRSHWRGLFGQDLPVIVYPLLLLALPLLARRPWRLSVLVIPLFRNRGQRPFYTLAEHFVYGFGALEAFRDLWRRKRM
jgi:GT2 family glycosyltransferase